MQALMRWFLCGFFGVFFPSELVPQTWATYSDPVLWKLGLIYQKVIPFPDHSNPFPAITKPETVSKVTSWINQCAHLRADGSHKQYGLHNSSIESSPRPPFSRGPRIESLDCSENSFHTSPLITNSSAKWPEYRPGSSRKTAFSRKPLEINRPYVFRCENKPCHSAYYILEMVLRKQSPRRLHVDFPNCLCTLLRDKRVQIVRTSTNGTTVMYSKTARSWPTPHFSPSLSLNPHTSDGDIGILLRKLMSLEWLGGTRGNEVSMLGVGWPPTPTPPPYLHPLGPQAAQHHKPSNNTPLGSVISGGGETYKVADRVELVMKLEQRRQMGGLVLISSTLAE